MARSYSSLPPSTHIMASPSDQPLSPSPEASAAAESTGAELLLSEASQQQHSAETESSSAAVTTERGAADQEKDALIETATTETGQEHEEWGEPLNAPKVFDISAPGGSEDLQAAVEAMMKAQMSRILQQTSSQAQLSEESSAAIDTELENLRSRMRAYGEKIKDLEDEDGTEEFEVDEEELRAATEELREHLKLAIQGEGNAAELQKLLAALNTEESEPEQ